MAQPFAPPPAFLSPLLVATALAGPVLGQPAKDGSPPIVVRHNKQIAVNTISCRRIALGEPEDYKPSVVQLPSGDLLLVVFAGKQVGGGKIREITRTYRSKDQGLSRGQQPRGQPTPTGQQMQSSTHGRTGL